MGSMRNLWKSTTVGHGPESVLLGAASKINISLLMYFKLQYRSNYTVIILRHFVLGSEFLLAFLKSQFAHLHMFIKLC